MYAAAELVLVLLWLFLPPVLLGVAALALLTRRRPRHWRLIRAALVLLAVSAAVAFLLVQSGPNPLHVSVVSQ
jgi:hypothetical protein